MNRQEAKQLLPIIQAFAEGKTILVQDGIDWCYLGNESNFNLNPQRYYIKPELKYRPFKDAEECWQEMQKHQPFGWVKINEEYEQIWHVNKDDDFNVILKTCIFADGTPFGIKEE